MALLRLPEQPSIASSTLLWKQSFTPRNVKRTRRCHFLLLQQHRYGARSELTTPVASTSSSSSSNSNGSFESSLERQSRLLTTIEHPSTTNATFEGIQLTGGAFDFYGATESLVEKPLMQKTKKVVLVRHGLSSWNKEHRIQGSSDLSVLSEEGALQAVKCKQALENIKFDQCFASPISRAKSTAELIWDGRKEPLVFLDTLREAHLHFLEGMKNEDANREFPELFRSWREDPANFHVDGAYPIVELWDRSRRAWAEILSAEGQSILVVTHKSILRALICTALGMGPKRFRSVDVNNGGICSFKINEQGEPMLQSLNMTSHLYSDTIRY